MTKKINIHYHIFLHAFRTAVIFVSGFIIYEMLVKLEKKWKENPSTRLFSYSKRKIIKFLLILIIDMILLYIIFFIFKVDI
jgi:hypothetical protein